MVNLKVNTKESTLQNTTTGILTLVTISYRRTGKECTLSKTYLRIYKCSNEHNEDVNFTSHAHTHSYTSHTGEK